MKEKYLCFTLIFIIILVIIGYIVFMLETYKQNKFIFKTFSTPSPGPTAFQPLGPITKRTAEEMEQRKSILTKSSNT
jgi:hypothetical protein